MMNVHWLPPIGTWCAGFSSIHWIVTSRSTWILWSKPWQEWTDWTANSDIETPRNSLLFAQKDAASLTKVLSIMMDGALAPPLRDFGCTLCPRKLQHTPRAHPRQCPWPTMKGIPLYPVGKGCSGCVPVRCVETTLHYLHCSLPSALSAYFLWFNRHVDFTKPPRHPEGDLVFNRRESKSGYHPLNHQGKQFHFFNKFDEKPSLQP